MENFENMLFSIKDDFIRVGVERAARQTLLPALTQKAYPGHYTVTADGHYFGTENTWPGLDSWEMAGAYLLLGMTDVVKNYFAFVTASQRADGNIPFAIFPAEYIDPETYKKTPLWCINYPDDIYTYDSGDGKPRRWIGLFTHWQPKANPLSVLGPISYLLTAAELSRYAGAQWLQDNIKSIERAGEYLLGRICPNGLMDGSGFYIELPPRAIHDGTTQCYAARSFSLLSEMFTKLNDSAKADKWRAQADKLTQSFRSAFWTGRHFAEYIHPQRGRADTRYLTDVDLAAVALGVATDEQAAVIWPQLTKEGSLWHGGIPTQLVSLPFSYEDWELNEPVPFELPGGRLYDVSAMGRVWYLDVLASVRMGDKQRLEDSVRLVCRRGEADGWYWFERYHAKEDGTAVKAGPQGYCEYAAILTRAVLGNMDVFGV